MKLCAFDAANRLREDKVSVPSGHPATSRNNWRSCLWAGWNTRRRVPKARMGRKGPSSPTNGTSRGEEGIENGKEALGKEEE